MDQLILHLAASLLQACIPVVAADNGARTGAAQNLAWLTQQATQHNAKLTISPCDITQPDAVQALVSTHAKRLQVVAHLAGQVAMTTSLNDPQRDFAINAQGTLNMLEALRTTAPHAIFLYSSTNKVYGSLSHLRHTEQTTRWYLPDLPHGINETTPLAFASPYGCSKGAADQYALDYARSYGLRTVVLRHGSMYGGRQFATVDQGWIGWFCQQAWQQAHQRNTPPTPICGDGKQVRDILYVDDAVSCYQQAANTPQAWGQAFNIGGGPDNSLSLRELFTWLEQTLDSPFRYTQTPARLSDQLVFIADNRKAQKIFQWTPKIPWQQGLADQLAWVSQSHRLSR